jgi:hypothetical protein
MFFCTQWGLQYSSSLTCETIVTKKKVYLVKKNLDAIHITTLGLLEHPTIK